MFIMRDEFTQVDGVEVAKRKTIEWAMSKSDFHVTDEMRHMISGVLGCTPQKTM